MLPRFLLLYFVSFSLAADTAAKADLPASDLRKLSHEDLVELDEFLSRVQQVLHPKDTVVDKLESVQAPFARLVAKLASVPPVKPLHRLTRKVRNGDDAFAAQDDVAAAADTLLADQRESYLSMRLILDALFGMEDGESDGESGSDSDDSDSDEEEDADEEEEEEEGEDGEEAEDGEEGEDGEEVEGGEDGEEVEGGEEDLDDYDWFYRIFGSKDKGARAAVDKAPGVASLEIAALAQRSRAVHRAVQPRAESAKSEAKSEAPAKSTAPATSSAPTKTTEAAKSTAPSSKLETRTKRKSSLSAAPESKHVAPTTSALPVASTSESPVTPTTTTSPSTPVPTSLAYVKPSTSVEPESSTLKLEYAVPEETPAPEQTVPEETAPVIVGPEESDACNLTFGNWSLACAPTTSGSARQLSVVLAAAVAATTLFAIFWV